MRLETEMRQRHRKRREGRVRMVNIFKTRGGYALWRHMETVEAFLKSKKHTATRAGAGGQDVG